MIDARLDEKLEERIESWKDVRDLSFSRIKDKEKEIAAVSDEYCLARIGEAVALYNEAVCLSLVPAEAQVHGEIIVRRNSLLRRHGNVEEAYLPIRGGPNKEILSGLFALMRQAVRPQYRGSNPYAQHGEYRISLPENRPEPIHASMPYEGRRNHE
jgi:hypothetical protein